MIYKCSFWSRNSLFLILPDFSLRIWDLKIHFLDVYAVWTWTQINFLEIETSFCFDFFLSLLLCFGEFTFTSIFCSCQYVACSCSICRNIACIRRLSAKKISRGGGWNQTQYIEQFHPWSLPIESSGFIFFTKRAGFWQCIYQLFNQVLFTSTYSIFGKCGIICIRCGHYAMFVGSQHLYVSWVPNFVGGKFDFVHRY